MSTSADFVIRRATPEDAVTVADLHTRSWQTAYRGIMSDHYLDTVAPEERRAAWREKLSPSAPDQRAVFLADRSGRPAGFVCAAADQDAEWGSFIDTLHVAPEQRGSGAGRRLLQAAAGWLLSRGSSGSVYLWVFEDNTPARGFYRRMGAVETTPGWRNTPEGRQVPGVRCVWSSAQTIAH